MQTKSSLVHRNSARKLKGELLVTYIAFMPKPATMRMIEVSTGILRPNICRYVARLRKLGLISFEGLDYCPHTKHLAGFYSTANNNPWHFNVTKTGLWPRKGPPGLGRPCG